MIDYENVGELEEKDLRELIERGQFAERFFENRAGQLLLDACKRNADMIDRQIAYHSDPTNVSQNALLQTKLRFYKYEVKTLFESIIEEGKLATKILSEQDGEPTPEQGDEQDS